MNFELEPAQQTWRRRSSGKAAGAGGAERGGACGAVQRRSTSLAVLALGLAALSCLFGYCVLSESAPHDARTLRLVLLIFRHGARNPTTSYNSDPYKNYNWPDGLGSLTNVGKLQLYELGKRFRSYYGNFLSDEYLEKDAYVMSSDHSRCLMSAYTLLAGLYPPVGRHIWHPDIGWQPIPVHSIPRQYDKMIAAKKVCKTVDEQYDRVSRLVNSRPEYAELFDYLSKHTNQSMRSVLQVEFLFSALQIEQDAGLKLPEWTKNVYPDKIEEIAKTSLAMFTYNDMMKRLRAGPLLDDVMSKLRHKVAGTLSPDRSLFLYSSHDITIVNLWRALGFEELLRPEYGASIVLELHQEPEGLEHHVKALYWNNTKVDSPLELKLPLCNEPCTIRDFQLSLQHLIPDDWEAECNK